MSGAADAYLSNTNNNYDGETDIQGGVLELAASEVIPDTSLVRLAAARFSAEWLQRDDQDRSPEPAVS